MGSFRRALVRFLFLTCLMLSNPAIGLESPNALPFAQSDSRVIELGNYHLYFKTRNINEWLFSVAQQFALPIAMTLPGHLSLLGLRYDCSMTASIVHTTRTMMSVGLQYWAASSLASMMGVIGSDAYTLLQLATQGAIGAAPSAGSESLQVHRDETGITHINVPTYLYRPDEMLRVCFAIEQISGINLVKAETLPFRSFGKTGERVANWLARKHFFSAMHSSVPDRDGITLFDTAGFSYAQEQVQLPSAGFKIRTAMNGQQSSGGSYQYGSGSGRSRPRGNQYHPNGLGYGGWWQGGYAGGGGRPPRQPFGPPSARRPQSLPLWVVAGAQGLQQQPFWPGYPPLQWVAVPLPNPVSIIHSSVAVPPIATSSSPQAQVIELPEAMPFSVILDDMDEEAMGLLKKLFSGVEPNSITLYGSHALRALCLKMHGSHAEIYPVDWDFLITRDGLYSGLKELGITKSDFDKLHTDDNDKSHTDVGQFRAYGFVVRDQSDKDLSFGLKRRLLPGVFESFSVRVIRKQKLILQLDFTLVKEVPVGENIWFQNVGSIETVSVDYILTKAEEMKKNSLMDIPSGDAFRKHHRKLKSWLALEIQKSQIKEAMQAISKENFQRLQALVWEEIPAPIVELQSKASFTTAEPPELERKQPERKQPERKQPERKQPERKQPERKQPEQKQPEQKQPEQKQPDYDVVPESIPEASAVSDQPVVLPEIVEQGLPALPVTLGALSDRDLDRLVYQTVVDYQRKHPDSFVALAGGRAVWWHISGQLTEDDFDQARSHWTDIGGDWNFAVRSQQVASGLHKSIKKMIRLDKRYDAVIFEELDRGPDAEYIRVTLKKQPVLHYSLQYKSDVTSWKTDTQADGVVRVLKVRQLAEEIVKTIRVLKSAKRPSGWKLDKLKSLESRLTLLKKYCPEEMLVKKAPAKKKPAQKVMKKRVASEAPIRKAKLTPQLRLLMSLSEAKPKHKEKTTIHLPDLKSLHEPTKLGALSSAVLVSSDTKELFVAPEMEKALTRTTVDLSPEVEKREEEISFTMKNLDLEEPDERDTQIATSEHEQEDDLPNEQAAHKKSRKKINKELNRARIASQKMMKKPWQELKGQFRIEVERKTTHLEMLQFFLLEKSSGKGLWMILEPLVKARISSGIKLTSELERLIWQSATSSSKALFWLANQHVNGKLLRPARLSRLLRLHQEGVTEGVESRFEYEMRTELEEKLAISRQDLSSMDPSVKLYKDIQQELQVETVTLDFKSDWVTQSLDWQRSVSQRLDQIDKGKLISLAICSSLIENLLLSFDRELLTLKSFAERSEKELAAEERFLGLYREFNSWFTAVIVTGAGVDRTLLSTLAEWLTNNQGLALVAALSRFPETQFESPQLLNFLGSSSWVEGIKLNKCVNCNSLSFLFQTGHNSEWENGHPESECDDPWCVSYLCIRCHGEIKTCKCGVVLLDGFLDRYVRNELLKNLPKKFEKPDWQRVSELLLVEAFKLWETGYPQMSMALVEQVLQQEGISLSRSEMNSKRIRWFIEFELGNDPQKLKQLQTILQVRPEWQGVMAEF